MYQRNSMIFNKKKCFAFGLITIIILENLSNPHHKSSGNFSTFFRLRRISTGIFTKNGLGYVRSIPGDNCDVAVRCVAWGWNICGKFVYCRKALARIAMSRENCELACLPRWRLKAEGNKCENFISCIFSRVPRCLGRCGVRSGCSLAKVPKLRASVMLFGSAPGIFQSRERGFGWYSCFLDRPQPLAGVMIFQIHEDITRPPTSEPQVAWRVVGIAELWKWSILKAKMVRGSSKLDYPWSWWCSNLGAVPLWLQNIRQTDGGSLTWHSLLWYSTLPACKVTEI